MIPNQIVVQLGMQGISGAAGFTATPPLVVTTNNLALTLDASMRTIAGGLAVAYFTLTGDASAGGHAIVNASRVAVGTGDGTASVTAGTFGGAAAAGTNVNGAVTNYRNAFGTGAGAEGYASLGAGVAVASGASAHADAESARAYGAYFVVRAGFARAPKATQAASFTVLRTDSVCPVDTTTGVLTATLPAAASVPPGWQVRVEDVGGQCGANTATVAAAGTDTLLDGGTTVLLSNAYAYAEVRSDGVSKWKVVARSNPTAVGAPGSAVSYQGAAVVLARDSAVSTTVLATDSRIYLTAAGLTVTLDSGLPDGTTVEIIDASGGAQATPHSLTPNNGRTINGTSTASLGRSYGGQTVAKRAGNWIAPQ